MRPPKFCANRSIGRRVIAFPTFFSMAALTSWILFFYIFDHVTVIEVLICWGVPNFIKTGSRIWPPDARNCWMFNASLLGNRCCHGNHIMADMSGIWWYATTQVSFKSVHFEGSYVISSIFQYGGRPPFWTLKIVTFDHVTVILVLICCCVPNFIKIGSRRPSLLQMVPFESYRGIVTMADQQ